MNGLLVDYFLAPLQRLRYRAVYVIDCLNYATHYPKLFNHVDNDPNVLYIFVGRGNFMSVPDKTRGDKRF